MRKLFVILEQGCEINYSLSKKHKDQFSTDFCDCFRLNWKNDKKDKYADFFKDNVCWSEGRSFLYEQTKDNYEYFIFIDDDIDFLSKTNKSPAEEIKYLLEKYSPFHGTITNDTWPRLSEDFKKEAYPLIGADLCVQILSADFCKYIFPTWFHGSGSTMWYPQFICYATYPQKNILFNSLEAKNTRSIMHEDNDFQKPALVRKKFAYLIKRKYRKSFLNWQKYVSNYFLNYLNSGIKLETKKILINKLELQNLFRDKSFIKKERNKLSFIENIFIEIQLIIDKLLSFFKG